MLDYLGARCKATTDHLIKPESYSMRENLIISGVDEEECETENSLYDALIELFPTEMSLDMFHVHFIRCHRTTNSVKKNWTEGKKTVFQSNNNNYKLL